jgi:cation diffusion facilitator CzcD-associated flavoprotein CzcO
MLTFGYSFHPWTRPEVLAPAGLILDYLREVVEKFGLEKYIHYSSPVAKAAWSSEDNRWSVTVAAPSSSSSSFPPRQIRAKYVFMCGGYYEYDKGNMPRFEGQHSFKGKIVHPQAWEEVEGPVDVKGGAAYAGSTGKVDVVGKRVAVIGSGATAVTLVPELVKQGAAHVTCVQRSPSYLYSVSPQDWFVKLLTSVGLPASTAAQLGRKRQAYLQVMSFRFCTAFPTVARFLLLGLVRLSLGNGADMTHFSPKYDPWKQRLCAIVSGDFFTAVGTEGGGASMATGHIDRFTPQGILMKGGQEVKADIIVTATGMNMQRVSHRLGRNES